MKSGVWINGSREGKITLSSLMPAFIVVLSLLVGGVLGAFGLYALAALIMLLLLLLCLLLRRDELAAILVLAVHLYADWYLGLHIIAPFMALLLLAFYYFSESEEYPWIRPQAFWLWALFLILTIYPAFKGALMLFDLASYYPSDIFGALVIYWLGLLIARDSRHVRLFFQAIALAATLLAIHTLIQTFTGVVLFATAHYDSVYQATSDYLLSGSSAHRAGSFFVDPNWNGTFFAMMLFIPAGLFFESRSLPAKLLYLVEIGLMLLALAATYSTGAWIATLFGLVCFILFVGRMRYRVLLPLIILLTSAIIVVLFPDQLALQWQHATASDEFSLRLGAWQTALNVIQAYPLTGIGMGYQNYYDRSNMYRVPAQFVQLSHPHNSYLELGAMAGVPALCIFLALLLLALWLAIQNWRRADIHTRSLLGGGIASILTLSVNSFSINAWTHPALVMIGWGILGVLASPLLTKSLRKVEVPTADVAISPKEKKYVSSK